MKKTLLAILAAFVAATPLAGVKAAEIDYTIGTEQNFLVNKEQDDKHKAGDETVGIKVISLGDDENNNGYVKALATGANTWLGQAFIDPASTKVPASFEETLAYEKLLEDFNGTTAENADTYMRLVDKLNDSTFKYDTQLTTPYVANYNTDHKNLTVPTKDDILSWFANEKVNDTKYKLTADGVKRFAQWYSYSLVGIGIDKATGGSLGLTGYLTSTFEKTTNDYLFWVVVPTFNAAGELEEVTVETVSNTALFNAQQDPNATLPVYVMVPVLSFNKEYNCKFEYIPQYACYKCDDKYQWLIVGEQASTCTIVAGVNAKAKCTDNPKTGVEDYILEFAIAAGVCGIVLLAVKRKSLFSRV